MAKNAEIAEHLVMSVREVQMLRAKGVIPAAGASLDDCRVAYITRMRETAAGRVASPQKSDLDTERARLASEQADMAAMKNALMRRETAPLAAITQAVVGMIEVAKAHLNRVPGKVAPSDAALRARISAAIEDALMDLSAERAVETAMPADNRAEEADDAG